MTRLQHALRCAVAFAIMALGGTAAGANDIYIAQTSAGAGTGADCADAYAYTFFNAAGNWGTGAGKISPGTTVHLCGTFTGTAGQTLLTSQGNGSSGSPITIHFETGAVLTAPYWSSNGAIRLFGAAYIVVDGGTNGIIQNTANGTGLAYQQSSRAIVALYACNYCEVKNLTVSNLYVHAQCEASSGCDTTVDQTSVNAVQFSGTNVLIHDNTIHDIGWAIFQEYVTNGDTGIQIYNNNIYNMDHGFAGGAGPNVTVPLLSIYNNHFHDMAAWDTGTADHYHHDGIHIFSSLSPVGKIQNLYIYNNLFDGNEGSCCVTAWVFLEGGASAGSTPWTDSTGTAYIFNNVIVGSIDTGNGQLSIGSGTGHQVLNNTILGVNQGKNGSCLLFDTAATNVTVENNAISGCNQLLANGNPQPTSFALIDYNAYGGNITGGNPHFNFAAFNANTFSAWRTVCGCDAHSVASLGTAFSMTSEGAPQAVFMGLRAGADLSSLATGPLASLSSDTSAGGTHTPVVRPSSGAWDMGAYAYSSAVNPPTGLTVVVH